MVSRSQLCVNACTLWVQDSVRSVVCRVRCCTCEFPFQRRQHESTPPPPQPHIADVLDTLFRVCEQFVEAWKGMEVTPALCGSRTPGGVGFPVSLAAPRPDCSSCRCCVAWFPVQGGAGASEGLHVGMVGGGDSQLARSTDAGSAVTSAASASLADRLVQYKADALERIAAKRSEKEAAEV
jgi:hypothetical protein